VSEYRIEAASAVAADIEAAFEWYQREEPDLGFEFLDELRDAYKRILEGPLKYSVLRYEIRRALARRFPYAIYFSVEGDVIVVLGVHRDPKATLRAR
jgi:hypothetical protein